jgi:glycosyltransferase involved in cell wall biosynthesis
MDSVEVVEVSIVIPCFNEQDSLPQLLDRIIDTSSSMLGHRLTVVMVDDGSSDGTWAAIQELHERKGSVRIRGIRLAANHGKAVAQSVGIRDSLEAGLVVLMDADGQHDPRYLPEMLRVSESRCRPCAGMRRGYKRSLPSQLGVTALRMMTRLLGVDFDPSESEFVALPRWAAAAVAGDPQLGVIPVMGILHSKAEIDHVDISVPPRLAGSQSSRWRASELWRKGLLHLLADPWKVLPRAAGLVAITSLLMLAYGLYVGISSVIEGTFLGIGSVIVLQVIVFGILVALLLLVLGTQVAALRARSISDTRSIIGERFEDSGVKDSDPDRQ